MEDLIVKDVPFCGTELLAVQQKDSGKIYVGINSILRELGFNEEQVRYRRDKWNADKVLYKGVQKFSHPSKDGGMQETYCIEIKRLPLALAKIDITPKMEDDMPDLAEKLEKYQDECADVLAEAFLPDNSYWQQTRQEAKNNRLLETDAIKEFVAYAKGQGSQHAERYYCSLTQLANKAAGISQGRDKADIQQLNNLTLVEHIISEVLQDSMQQGKPYKEIYLACKARIEQFKKIAYLGK